MNIFASAIFTGRSMYLSFFDFLRPKIHIQPKTKLKLKIGGHMALLFVITLAMALSVLTFSLTQGNRYILLLLDSYRENHNAREAAVYCKYYLMQKLILDAGYRPTLNIALPVLAKDVASIGVSTATYCMYKSFIERDVLTTDNIYLYAGIVYEVVVEGKSSNASHVLTSKFMVTNDIAKPLIELPN